MSLKDDIQALIDAKLPDNSANEISARDARESFALVLDNLDNLGSNYYGTVTTSSSAITSPAEGAMVLPLENGTYSNFSGLKKFAELCVFEHNGTAWTKKSIGGINNAQGMVSTIASDAISVNSTALTLTIKANRQVDIYYNNTFHRINNPSDVSTNLYAGSGYIYFDPNSKDIKSAGTSNTNGKIIIGTNIGGKVHLNIENYELDGEVVTIDTSETQIIEAVSKDFIGKKTNEGFLLSSPAAGLELNTSARTLTFKQNNQIDLFYANTFNRFIPPSDTTLTIPSSGVGYIYFDVSDTTYKVGSASDTYNKVIVGWYTAADIFLNASQYYKDGVISNNNLSDKEVAEKTNTNGYGQALPDNQTSLERVHNAAMSYINGEDAVIFPILTDMHASGDDAVWINHIDQVMDFDRFFNYDFIANLGDIGLDLTNTTTEDQAKDYMRDIAYRSNRFKGVTSWAHGNHDWNNVGDYLVSANEWKSRFTNQRNRIGNNYKTFNNSSCFDLPDKKIRVINLDTSAIYPYGFSIDDLQFFSDCLTITESGWQVIILTHFCTNAIGAWATIPYAPILYTSAFKNIIADFKAKNAGSYTSASWDFTGNGSDVIIGNFSGDSHFDASTVEAGVTYTITQGYGGIGAADVPTWANRWTRPNPDTMLIDVVVVKPNQNEFKMFRLGIGNDRSFTY